MRQVNFTNRTIRLDPGTTKNKEGREVAMRPKVFELLRAACEGKSGEDHVLTREGGGPVRDGRRAWQNLCVRAGLGELPCRKCAKSAELQLEAAYQCPDSKNAKRRDFRHEGLIPHDMHRSAAKALRRAGVPESVIMATGGWKTAAMFRRYAIVSSADSREAMEALERARKARSLDSALIAPTTSAEAERSATPKPQ